MGIQSSSNLSWPIMETNFSSSGIIESCSNVSLETENLGPARLYEMFGVTMVMVYTLLPLLISLLLLYALYYRPSPLHPNRLLILVLQLVPVTHLALTFPVLLSPATIPLVSLLQDLVVMFAMVAYVHFTLDIIGGLENVDSSCPIGTPPLCCLLCCRKPKITATTARLIILPFKLTPVALVINFLINIYLAYSGVSGKITLGGFFNLENLHNLLLIPFFVSTMYCWKIFMSVTAPAMPDKNQRLRGFLLFSIFIVCKTVPMILAILSAQNVIPCTAGVPAIRVAALLLALIEMFYVSVVGVVIPRLYSKSWVREIGSEAQRKREGKIQDTGDRLLADTGDQ